MARLRGFEVSPSLSRSGGDTGEVVEVWCSCVVRRSGGGALLRFLWPAEGARGGVGGVAAVVGLFLLCSCRFLHLPSLAGRGGEGGRAGEGVLRAGGSASRETGGLVGCVVLSVVEGSGARVPDLERVELGACRRPCAITVSDLVLRGWWILRFFYACWLEAWSALRVVAVVFVLPGGCAGDAEFRCREEEDGRRGLLCVLLGSWGPICKVLCLAHWLYPLRVYLYLYEPLYCFLTTV